MFKKHGILAVTMFLILIVAQGVGAETELEGIVNHPQTATWAYYTDEIKIENISSTSRWYISPLVSGVPNINDVFSLGPVINGVGGWWTIGKGVGTIDSAMSQIKIAPNLDTDPSNTFFDVGIQAYITNSQIHSDRQRVQEKTLPIVWYFFMAPNNNAWYIVNASRTGPSWDLYRFGWANGGYDWGRIDISGYSVAHTPDPSGHTLAVTFVHPFSIGKRVMAMAAGANVRNTQLADPVLFSQDGGVHGTIVGGPINASAGGFTGNWWQINWDSEPPNQNGSNGWSAESVISLAPSA